MIGLDREGRGWSARTAADGSRVVTMPLWAGALLIAVVLAAGAWAVFCVVTAAPPQPPAPKLSKWSA